MTIDSVAAFVHALYQSEVALPHGGGEVESDYAASYLNSTTLDLHKNVRISEVALDNLQTALAAQRRRLLLAMMVPEVGDSNTDNRIGEERVKSGQANFSISAF